MSPQLLFARRTGVAIVLALTMAGCSSLPSPTSEPPPPNLALSQAESVSHVLSRLTFGERSDDVQSVVSMGIGRWIDLQLRPETIPDSAVDAALSSMPAWSHAVRDVTRAMAPSPTAVPPVPLPQSAEAARLTALNQLRDQILRRGVNSLASGKVARAQLSNRQLSELIIDFWENHFNVYDRKAPSFEALIIWDRSVVRAHALGRFRDLLGAVAHSPQMLFYLDNHLSTNRGLNENFGRELLELHTLGADAGYTQQDVIEVARAFTGWGLESRTSVGPSVFVFRAGAHDTGTKTVLGHTLVAGRGAQDGEDVLDILARHPSTAHHIAFKLARRLVSDDPPPAVVDRAAATFTRTDGDIAAVIRSIVASPEFFARTTYRAKVKTPFESVVSMLRALDAPVDTSGAPARVIAQLGQPIFGRPSPDGWPDFGSAWINAGTMYQRLQFAADVAYGRLAPISVDRWSEFRGLSAVSLAAQVDAVVKRFLGGSVDARTREAMVECPSVPSDTSSEAGAQRLRALIAIALGSPEFQRR